MKVFPENAVYNSRRRNDARRIMPSEHPNPVKGEAGKAMQECGFLRNRLGLDVPQNGGVAPPVIGHRTGKMARIEPSVWKYAGSLNLENRIWIAASGGGRSAFSPAGLIPAM